MADKESKFKKVLSKSFIDNNKDVNEDQAGELIVAAEMTIKGLEEDMAQDEKLAAASSIVKDLKNGYSSAMRYERAKIKYLLEKITEIQDNKVNPSTGNK